MSAIDEDYFAPSAKAETDDTVEAPAETYFPNPEEGSPLRNEEAPEVEQPPHRQEVDNSEPVEDFDPEAKQDVLPWRAIVVGASGMIGRHLVKAISETPFCTQVTAVVRSEIPNLVETFGLQEEFADKVHQELVDFEELEEFKDVFRGYTRGFCCLGTTQTAAGSADAFRKVDFGFVVTSARLMKEAGVEHFSLVSAAGAKADAWVLYMKAKGQAELECRKLGFERLSIFRPQIIVDARPDNEGRRIQWLASKIVPNLHWALPDSARGLTAAHIASAIVLNAERYPAGKTELFKNAQIARFEVGRQHPPKKVPVDVQAKRACLSFIDTTKKTAKKASNAASRLLNSDGQKDEINEHKDEQENPNEH